MHFLNPQAFWAFLLLLIPILVHLFNLRRIKKVYFTNLTFLKEIDHQQKSKSTLKKLLILATRLLALSFIILAFAMPILTTGSEEAYRHPVIYLDNSLSMQRTDPGGNLLLFEGVSVAEGFIQDLPRGSDVGFFTNTESVLRPRPREEVLDNLGAVDFSKQSRQLADIYQKATRISADHLIVLSDLQKSVTASLDDLLGDTSRQVTFYKLRSGVESNLYVDSVFLTKPLGISTLNELNIRLRNTGSNPAGEVLVKLYRGNRQLSSLITSVETHGFTDITVEIGLNQEIRGSYRVEIEDSPVVFDNTFYFAIDAVPKPRIVILTEGAASTFLTSVYSNREYFDLKVFGIENASFQELTRADLLLLDHLPSIPDWLIGQLGSLAGQVLLIPPAEPDRQSYEGVLGLGLAGAPNQSAGTVSMSSFDHPFFEGIFQSRKERVGLPRAQPLLEPRGYYESLLKTNTGHQLLFKKANMYMFTFPLIDSLTDFHKHGLFVPVMYKLAQRTKAGRLSYRLDGGLIELPVDSLATDVLLTLAGPSGTYVPASRYVSGQLQMEIPEVLMEPGIYHLVAGQDTLRTLAFNYNKVESEIESFTAQEFANLIAGYDHVRLEEITHAQEFLEGRLRAGQDGLWKYALLLAIFFLVSEITLLRFIR